MGPAGGAVTPVLAAPQRASGPAPGGCGLTAPGGARLGSSLEERPAGTGRAASSVCGSPRPETPLVASEASRAGAGRRACVGPSATRGLVLLRGGCAVPQEREGRVRRGASTPPGAS